MTKESFNWKSLFINEESAKSQESKVVQSSGQVAAAADNKFQ
jgi:hypothetical protein